MKPRQKPSFPSRIAEGARVRFGLSRCLAVLAAVAGAPASSSAQEGVIQPEAKVAPAPDTDPFKSDEERFSYALGMSLGKQLEKLPAEVNTDVLIRAIEATLSGGGTLLTGDEGRAIVRNLQARLKEKQAALQRERREAWMDAARKNQAEGEAFFAENREKEGIATLQSGLQYRVLVAGEGKKPKIADSVACRFRGKLLDGTEFASSFERAEPVSFPIQKVIKGWRQALQLMAVGSSWILFVPPHLAYGAQGAGRTISPNATLIFEIELVAVHDGKAGAPRPPGEPKLADDRVRPLPAAAASGVPEDSGARILFESTVFDFGKIAAGATVRHDFAFINVGDLPLKITGARVGCGCTVVKDWSREVEPGESGSLPVEFRSARFEGPVSKSVVVSSNDPEQPNVTLEIKGTVHRGWKGDRSVSGEESIHSGPP